MAYEALNRRCEWWSNYRARRSELYLDLVLNGGVEIRKYICTI